MLKKRLISRFIVGNGKQPLIGLLSAEEYDFAAMHERAVQAIVKLGRTQREIAILMGIDVSIPLHERKNVPPTMENVVRVSRVLGVSVSWLLTGEPKNDVDFFVLGSNPSSQIAVANGEIQKSAIVQGNRNSTIIVKNHIGSDLDEQESELIRLFRMMDVKRKAEFLVSAYEAGKGCAC